MLGLFDWLFGTKPVQGVVQAVNNTVMTKPDGVYDGYAIVKGERISLEGVNPPVVTLLKILMRDWKKLKVVSDEEYNSYTVNFNEIEVEITESPSFCGEGCTYFIFSNNLDIKFTSKESNILCNTYIKLVEDSKVRLDNILRKKSQHKQNKQRRDMDKMLREKYNV